MKQAFAMQKGGVLSVLAVLVGLLLVVWPGSSSDVAGAGGVQALAQQAETRDEKIRRVENGLLPPSVIKGEPASLMKLEDRMRFHKTPGFSIAVINDGRIDWARSYGFTEAGGTKRVSVDTMFQAASITKPVVAMAALRLVQQGKLSLDEDVNLKLKSWKVPENEFTKDQKVTLRRLLSQDAGNEMVH